MSRSSWEDLPDVQEARPDVREALPYDRQRSGGPPVCPGVFPSPPQMFGSGRKVHLEVREWSGVPLVGPAVGRRPSRMSGRLVRMSGSVL